ncbi:hypothetical protein COO60DRAFT_1485507 [Scenedesmus sp. NREL 46B-D3]|nr:hypothetical protein COO60DRAFT_1485507 [Scenedesmus sp. NREL 46B-D3]
MVPIVLLFVLHLHKQRRGAGFYFLFESRSGPCRWLGPYYRLLPSVLHSTVRRALLHWLTGAEHAQQGSMLTVCHLRHARAPWSLCHGGKRIYGCIVYGPCKAVCWAGCFEPTIAAITASGGD